jgi:hypothetical protein
LDKQNLKDDCNWIKEKSTFPSNSYFLNLELSAWLRSIVNVEIA